jgi:hypothetical protein
MENNLDPRCLADITNLSNSKHNMHSNSTKADPQFLSEISENMIGFQGNTNFNSKYTYEGTKDLSSTLAGSSHHHGSDMSLQFNANSTNSNGNNKFYQKYGNRSGSHHNSKSVE